MGHTFYIEIYTDTNQRLGIAIRMVEDINKDIGMEFGPGEFRFVQLLKGKVNYIGGYKVYDDELMKDMVRGESYKYLGFRKLTGTSS